MIETNKIILGDAYELIKQIPDNSIDLVYTDIPYLYAEGGGGHSELAQRIANKRDSIKIISSGIDYLILSQFERVLKKVNMFVWCSKMQIFDILKFANGGGIILIFLYGARPILRRQQMVYGCQI